MSRAFHLAVGIEIRKVFDLHHNGQIADISIVEDGPGLVLKVNVETEKFRKYISTW